MLKSLAWCLAALLCTHAGAQIVVNEVHYHPVERPAFDASGNPVFQGTATIADLTDDVHEFVELYNPTAAPVSIAGWRMEGGIDFTFPAGTIVAPGGYAVVGKNPARIQSVYGISGVLGPFGGKLGNTGDTVRLVTPTNAVSDSVSYSPNFPWAICANQLGADDDFTGLNSASYQYKGRSLQRVSSTASSGDPANWLAVRTTVGGGTFADLPTPGAANLVSRPVPKPVVTQRVLAQVVDGSTIIRATQPVKVTVTFSSAEALSNVQVEYFVENLSAFGEPRNTVTMTAGGNGQYTATLPAQSDRRIVRWRIKADRGDGVELVSPRADDPAVVQVGPPTYPSTPPPPNAVNKVPAPREAWLTYFVTPIRSSTKPIIDVMVPTDGTSNTAPQFNGINGLQSMAYNCQGSPKRTTGEGTTSSYPRETPYVLSSDRIWDDTIPGVFASNGVAYDIQIRYHGSRYNRNPGRKSFKVFFPEYSLYTDGAGVPVSSVFETDKNDMFMTAHGLNRIANLPLSPVRYVDWYFNTDGLITRLEQGEYNGEMLDAYHDKIQRLNPGSVKEETGELYKSTGFISSPNTNGEGPYGAGNSWRLPAGGFWTELQRFQYTYGLQNHGWKGAKPMRDMVNGMWTARGDNITSTATVTSNPNVPNTKAWFQANWDVDTELTSLALANWMSPWDDAAQNHYLWRRTNGKWVRLLWDFDSMYGAGTGNVSTSSIYHLEVGDSSNNSRGPNFVVDSFLKAFRNEYKQRLWELANTLLDPENLQTLTYKNSSGASVTYFSFINSQSGGYATGRFNYVNSQLGLGGYFKPVRPTNAAPANGAPVLPGTNFVGSTYTYNGAFTHAPAPIPSPHTKSKWEIRTAASDYDSPVYLLTSTTNLTSLPIPFGELTYGQSYFWRVTYIDALGHPSITSAETSFSYGPTSTTAGNVTINELMAENLGAVSNGADKPDYVEMKNNTAAAIDISGWGFTDDELVPARYVFPAGTTIATGEYLIVWCDGNTASPGLHSGFGLSRKGQRVILTQAGVVRDAISFGPQLSNGAIGRVSDGTGAWTLINPSPGATNAARAFSTDASTLKINEWMALPASGEDWLEIYNPGAQPVALAGLWLSDTPGTPKTTQIPAISFAGAGGCVRFDADGTNLGFSSVNFKLATGGETLVLTATDGYTTVDAVSFGAQQPGLSEGRFPDGNANKVTFPRSSSPNDNNWLPAEVRVNEALSNSLPPLEDYVEIHNPTASEVDIGGWWLSDDHFARQKYQVPAGTSVPAGGYVTLTESQFSVGANGFSLSSFGDEIVLSATSGAAETGYRTQVNFGASADNVAFGFVATAGTPEFWPQIARTSGAGNSAPAIGSVIVNEVHYHPPDLSGADNVRDEFVELHNITTNPVSIENWKLKGASDFTFAAGTTIRPGDYILVVGFNPVADAASLAAFRAAFNLPTSVPMYGPFSKKLANDTSNVELGFPGTAVDGVTPYINMDKVEYFDFTPWPVAADGTGSSLQRQSRTIIGNDAVNYVAAMPTPGAVNTGEAPILDNDGDGISNVWEDSNGLDKFSAADAVLDSDGDGRVNLDEYRAGTSPRNGADFFVSTVTKANPGPGFVISFLAKAGRVYTIEYKNSLSDAAWQTLIHVPGLPSDTPVQHTDPTALPTRFYQVRTTGP